MTDQGVAAVPSQKAPAWAVLTNKNNPPADQLEVKGGAWKSFA